MKINKILNLYSMYSIFLTFKGGVYKIKKKSIGRKKHAKTEYIEYICIKPC